MCFFVEVIKVCPAFAAMGEGGFEQLSGAGKTKTSKRNTLLQYEVHINASYEVQELKDTFRKAFEGRQEFSNGRTLVMSRL
jgi:hypothetical protein